MNPWNKLKKWFTEPVILVGTPKQVGNVVQGDIAGRDLVKQTIIGNGNIQSSSNVQVSSTRGSGVSIIQQNGHVTITGQIRSLNVNGVSYEVANAK